MNLVPWKSKRGMDLFQDLDDIQKEMNQLFNLNMLKPFKTGEVGVWVPAVDILDEKDHIKVRADLPGMKKDDIEVTVDHDVLTIKGEKKEEKEAKEKDYVRSERFYGSFRRSFTLPSGIDSQKVVAAYKEGVLEVNLPKKEEAKSMQKKVNID